VIGFDDMEFARVLDPPLTTVALDPELLGATSFELLELRLNGRRTRKRVVLPAAAGPRVDGRAETLERPDEGRRAAGRAGAERRSIPRWAA